MISQVEPQYETYVKVTVPPSLCLVALKAPGAPWRDHNDQRNQVQTSKEEKTFQHGHRGAVEWESWQTGQMWFYLSPTILSVPLASSALSSTFQPCPDAQGQAWQCPSFPTSRSISCNLNPGSHSFEKVICADLLMILMACKLTFAKTYVIRLW